MCFNFPLFQGCLCLKSKWCIYICFLRIIRLVMVYHGGHTVIKHCRIKLGKYCDLEENLLVFSLAVLCKLSQL